MGLLIVQILDTFNDFNKVICPGFYKAYLRAQKQATPVRVDAHVSVPPESEDYNFFLTPAQKMSAKYCAESLFRLNGMPKARANRLSLLTDQYMEGVITDWEYIERVVEAAEAALEAANQILYKGED